MAKEIGQAFGGIGDAVSGVVKGIGDVVNGAVKGVGSLAKQIWDSKIGKAIVIAGAIYFGGAALAGGFGGASAGGMGSFFSGMGAGVSSAAGSLSSAWGSALAGEFGAAGSTLGGSWGAAYGAGAGTAPVALVEGAASSFGGGEEVGSTFSGGSGPAAQPEMAGGYGSGMNAGAAPPPPPPPAPYGLNTPYTAPGLPPGGAASPYSLTNASTNLASSGGTGLPSTLPMPPVSSAPMGMFDKVISSPYTAPALISGAMQVGGAVIAGAGQKKAQEDQQEYERRMMQEQIDRRNANVGANLFAPGQYAAAPGPAPQPMGLAARYMPQPGAGYVPGSRFAEMYNQLPPGYGAVRAVTG